VSSQAPIWGPRPNFYYCHTLAGLLRWGVLSDEGMGLSFTIAAGPRQRSHSQVRVPRDSWPYVIVSDSRLPQRGGPGPRIYIPQEQGVPVKIPRYWAPFRPILRLAGLRWRYSTWPPHGDSQLQLKVTLRLSVYLQSVGLWANPLVDYHRNFFFNWTPAVTVLM
jgi:hypothetical protein